MTMLSRQNMVNTIFGCMWQKCHTLANLGWMYLCDFYTIFRKCYFEYILSKTETQNWGSPGLFRSYSAKCKQQSQLRKFVNTTRRYVLRKKFLTLSLCWIFSFVVIFGNIFQEGSVEQRWKITFVGHSLEMKYQPFTGRVSLCCTLQIFGQPSKGHAQNVNLGRIKGHSSAKAAWLRCMGFYKKNTYFYSTTSSLSKKNQWLWVLEQKT